MRDTDGEVRVARQVAQEVGIKYGLDADELLGEAWLAVNAAAAHPRRDDRDDSGWERRAARWSAGEEAQRLLRPDNWHGVRVRIGGSAGRMAHKPVESLPTADDRWRAAGPIWSRWPLDVRRWVYQIVFDGATMTTLAAKEGVSRRQIWRKLRDVWPDDKNSPFNRLQCSRSVRAQIKKRKEAEDK